MSSGHAKTRPTARTVATQPAASTTSRPAKPAKPSAFAPKWEKQLYKALSAHDVDQVVAVAEGKPEAQRTAAALEVVYRAWPGDMERARVLLSWLVGQAYEPTADAFLVRYAPDARTSISVAEGVTVELPLSADSLGLMLAESLQAAGDLSAATAVVEQLDPSTVAAVSLAELYGQQKRWADVIDLTNGLQNDDDASVFLLIQRGVALRESGSLSASREVFREALRFKSRAPQLRHHALVERAHTYLAERKPSMARKDLERVLAEDASYPGLAEALESLAR
ncbi:tetratricopeptide repeat protein [Luteimicrobium sp. NPDC057192]|uniref:tetratricopeptide repeat protein n=1 Tax=Luteimicrobium sp. NPDC057192 TaxID=3346042 RepID=UPI00363C4A46